MVVSRSGAPVRRASPWNLAREPGPGDRTFRGSSEGFNE
jgi:hypothetical protein